MKMLGSYLLDWIVVLGTVAFAGSTSIWVVPNTRPFSLDDISIQFPFQTAAKIPTWLLLVCSVLIPILVILLLTLALPSPRPLTGRLNGLKRKLYCLNTAWLGLALSLTMAILITNGLKNLLGRPRPDLISRCHIDPNDVEAIKKWTIGPGKLLDWRICQTVSKGSTLAGALNEADIRDGFRSFPSGHCSMSFAGLTYLSIFLAEFVFALSLAHQNRHSNHITSSPIMRSGRNKRTDEPDTPLPRFPIMLALLICGVPLLLATYIASTRYSDYRHHTFDILAGSILGLVSAFVGWRWYGAWSCAMGDGRVYGLAERLRLREEESREADLEAETIGTKGPVYAQPTAYTGNNYAQYQEGYPQTTEGMQQMVPGNSNDLGDRQRLMEENSRRERRSRRSNSQGQGSRPTTGRERE
ncbi:phosphatidic acid phosphatase type 2/haloperoxidase [Pyronema omphalodes]|nr:phosphatidic acid phosphatase type 2/haloperoxidase [Pyronema omphalodes]